MNREQNITEEAKHVKQALVGDIVSGFSAFLNFVYAFSDDDDVQRQAVSLGVKLFDEVQERGRGNLAEAENNSILDQVQELIEKIAGNQNQNDQNLLDQDA